MTQSLSEQICQLGLSSNMNKFDNFLQYFIPYNMAVNFYVFHSFMENRIRTYVECCLAVTEQQGFSAVINLKIF